MSKRIKSISQKEFERANDMQKRLISDIKNPNQGVSRNGLLLPEDVRNQDILGNEAERNKKINKGKSSKILTGEDIQQEVLERREEYKRQFEEQLLNWTNKDFSKEYENLSFGGENYLVRVFAMDMTNLNDDYKETSIEWNEFSGWKIGEDKIEESIKPIVKVIKLGLGIDPDLKESFKVGDILTVPFNEVTGRTINPEFAQHAQFAKSQGMKPVIPEGMSKYKYNIEINWGRWQFTRPWVFEPETEDKLTFVIPKGKIIGEYGI